MVIASDTTRMSKRLDASIRGSDHIDLTVVFHCE